MWRPRFRVRGGLMLVVLAIASAVVIFLETQWSSAVSRGRSVPDEPFRIAGNLYYVGATGVTSFLLTSPEGHVLIDGGYPETAPLIVAAMGKLGFDIRDVKILLNTHAHNDHAGGLRELQQASGAELWVSEGDVDVMRAGTNRADPALGPLRYVAGLLGSFPPPRIDHVFTDGAVVRLGPIALTAHITAGHTRGCTSWSFPVRAADRDLLAVDVCSLTLFPMVKLAPSESYPGVRSDFERSFQTLRALPADIFLASHADMFGLRRKRARSKAAEDSVEPYLDRAGYLAYIDRSEKHFQDVLAGQLK